MRIFQPPRVSNLPNLEHVDGLHTLFDFLRLAGRVHLRRNHDIVFRFLLHTSDEELLEAVELRLKRPKAAVRVQERVHLRSQQGVIPATSHSSRRLERQKVT